MRFNVKDAEALRRVMAWRRDVRHFAPDPVDAAVMARLREAVDGAPSVGNARPWRFIEVKDAGVRAAVRADFAACNAAAQARYDGDRREAYAALKLAGLDAAPVQIAVFTDLAPVEGYGLGRQTMPQTLRQSTAMAIHALWLAARAENIGLGMVSILNPDTVAGLLDAPADWAFEAWLCLGHATFDDDTPLLHRMGWQENRPAVWRAH